MEAIAPVSPAHLALSLSENVSFQSHNGTPTYRSEAKLNEKHGVSCMGRHAGVDYNLTLCPLQSRLQHIYHGQHARVDFNPTYSKFTSIRARAHKIHL